MAALEINGVSSDDCARGLVMAMRRPTALAARSTAANPHGRDEGRQGGLICLQGRARTKALSGLAADPL
jgi:hypothetical protein